RHFLAGAGAIAAAPMISRSARAQLKPIKVAWIRQYAPAAVVQKSVELAAADGLTVELINFNRGLDGMIALQKGDAIAANCLVGYTQVWLALSQGIDLTVVSGAIQDMMALVVSRRILPAGEIDDKNMAYTGSDAWRHLVGKKVGLARGSHAEFLLRSY